ncbi:DUF4955 domain-containing protein [Reichenbachiella ulvae]|uniref:DUF4955 domain-containing protein n=1 Tax=Reichenbachiella ulvae TaxID=2980104 RepID=A0ABT3CV00_9BACT|nr:DUF4955 domain-containing protein [Reichenbachiella ulvae]MCV9387300.1 DUF4955 domain-containing protein [Reichenbachiella ulvae]
MRKLLLFIMAMRLVTFSKAQVAPIWEEYVADQEAGQISRLPDYSYAGYHFSEEEIPDVSGWTYFDVTDYGADGTDELHDDTAIQAAIDAAQAHEGPAVVYFPAGRFVVSEDNDVNHFLQVSRDSIVLKGSGTDQTEIYMDQMRVKNGHWQFLFKPDDISAPVLTYLEGSSLRGSHEVMVEDPSALEPGMIVYISHKSEAFARAHFGDLELSSDWTRLFGATGGMTVHEPHLIESISGNRVRFKNPVQTDLPEVDSKYQLRLLPTIKEVGVEDILFSSNWENYGEDFVHHKDDIHDYAWNAIQFNNTSNAWIRNCEFRSWSQVVDVRHSLAVTIENITLSGKKGHASFLTRRSYGLLVKDCIDQAGQHHGPGTGYSGVNTVYLRHEMQVDQSFDSHSGQPYATLVDNVNGGVFNKNGGPHESYPHHARHLTFWNFKHRSTGNIGYDLWSMSRNGNTYAEPFFVGFQADQNVTLTDTGLNELEGQQVEPASLFEAQLSLRLEALNTLPKLKFVSPGQGDRLAIGTDLSVEAEASDPDGSITAVSLYINELLIREDTEAPYLWNGDLDTPLQQMEAGQYKLKLEAIDDAGNVTREEIEIIVGMEPLIEFVRPAESELMEAGTDVVVEVSASDEDGSIASVDLYLDGATVSTLTASPYVWEGENMLSAMQSGSYLLKAVVTDNDGLTADVEQTLIVNELPTVSFSEPTALSIDEGVPVYVDVLAEDGDGSIARVDLYLNDEFLREEVNPPYIWGDREDLDPELFALAAGDYTLKAIAIDDKGSKNEAVIDISIIAEEVLGLDETQSAFHIYPNPARDRITLMADQDIIGVRVLDSSGRLWKSWQPTSRRFEMDLTSLSPGVYLLQLLSPNQQQTLPLIKQEF